MPLNIEINSDYKLTSDALNIIVKRKIIIDPTKAPNWLERAAKGADPTPREDWREVAYFAGVDQAVKWIMNQRIRESNAENLTELLDEIKRFEREISTLKAK